MIDVTCAVIVQDSKVFICRRNPEKSLGGFWEFPGGKVEEGESYQECLARELKEELGMDVVVKQHIISVEHEYSDISLNLIAFECDLLTFNGPMNDHDLCDWSSVEDLHKLKLSPADIPIVEALSGLLPMS